MKKTTEKIIKLKRYLSYDDAKIFVHSLNLTTYIQWHEYAATKETQAPYLNQYNVPLPYKPKCIVKRVSRHYVRSGEWKNWADFLGITRTKKIWLSYEQARAFVHTLNLKNQFEWLAWHDANKPHRIVKNQDYYIGQNTWVSWSDFLGTDSIANRIIKNSRHPLMVARKKIHSLHITKVGQYIDWWHETRPIEFPRHAQRSYRKIGVWGGWADFLGTSIYSRMQVISVEIGVIYIAQYPSYPSNVYEVAIEHKGEHEVYEKVKAKGGTILRIFENDKNNSSGIRQIMQLNCSAWWEGGGSMYIIQNVYQLINDFGLILKWVNTKPIYAR